EVRLHGVVTGRLDGAGRLGSRVEAERHESDAGVRERVPQRRGVGRERLAGVEVGKRRRAELDLASRLEGHAAPGRERTTPLDGPAERGEWSPVVVRVEVDGEPLDLDPQTPTPGRSARGRIEAAPGDEAPGVVGGEDA